MVRRELQGWGRVGKTICEVVPVRSVDDIRAAISVAATSGRSVTPRGSAYSYGDAALNQNNLVLDFLPMSRILRQDFDEETIDVEPGVTIREVLDHLAPGHRRLAVAPGTAGPTVGGAVAANVHGKNAWRAGPLGDHVAELELLTADGHTLVCGPNTMPGLFFAVCGGYGLLGLITRVRLRLCPPSPPIVAVEQVAAPSIDHLLEVFRRRCGDADHMVGWIDGHAGGIQAGRGLVQIAIQLEDGVALSRDPGAAGRRRPLHNRLGRSSGRAVRNQAWRLLVPLWWRPLGNWLNAARYESGSLWSGRVTVMSYERFQFLHDRVPRWNLAFKRGLIQYQIFVPGTHASTVFRKTLEAVSEANCPPVLAVLKMHRSDGFLLSYGVDGFSLSLDLPVARDGPANLAGVLSKLTDTVVLPAGGRFYPAKDQLLRPSQAAASFGHHEVREFLALKRRLDPDSRFQSDLYRRVLLPNG